jgi:hypothetical protein
MNFDWYSATVDAPPDEVIGSALRAYSLSSPRPCKPVNGYTQGMELHAGDEVLCRAFWGGVNGEDTTHLGASGSRSPAFAAFLRSVFPSHRVSRLDVAVDHDYSGAWSDLSGAALRLIKQRSLTSSTVGDWLGEKKGRTLYVGSRKSAAYMRIYEKGLQLNMSPSWVRSELVLQPSKQADKARLATITPEAAWGAAAWSRAYIAAISSLSVEALDRTPEAPTNHERALHFLCKQYGKTLIAQSDALGSWQALGLHLRDLIELQALQSDDSVAVLPTSHPGQLSFDFAPPPGQLNLSLS